MLLAVGLIFQ